uniref:Secreted protein n=2 Tax=Oryza sativa subsp. japonica TaxID=39947 RepID=Q53PN5_ORYSJ|nr:hypothetical protein LOC_Os11g06360 [Oryza sativa Japonica Group]ABA91663.1 hypothetical protein LOC_Os11g06360 [Oryza sativa Japonica Group]
MVAVLGVAAHTSAVLSLLLLAVEVAAYLQGWNLEEVASLPAIDGLFAAPPLPSCSGKRANESFFMSTHMFGWQM